VRSCPHFSQRKWGPLVEPTLQNSKTRSGQQWRQNGQEGNKVAEVKSGSVTLPIFQSRNSRKVPKKPVEGTPAGSTPEFEIKYYDSFVIPYYEGSIRKTPRRSTLQKATKFAEAVRLGLLGAHRRGAERDGGIIHGRAARLPRHRAPDNGLAAASVRLPKTAQEMARLERMDSNSELTQRRKSVTCRRRQSENWTLV
jgi:hypothetical protein